MRIVLAEDNEMLARGLIKVLRDVGHTVDWLANGADASVFLAAEGADMAIVDIGLPGLDGREVVREMRARGDAMPVLILTAHTTVDERVSGLDAGADDYLTKPFAMAEFLARIRALSRRIQSIRADTEKIGRLRYDRASRQLSLEDQEIQLSRRETALFDFLVQTLGRISPKGSIVEAIYGVGIDVDDNAVELLISRLRKKLAGSDAEIRTVRGLGYTLRAVNG